MLTRIPSIKERNYDALQVCVKEKLVNGIGRSSRILVNPNRAVEVIAP
jgi:hypothetical protein